MADQYHYKDILIGDRAAGMGGAYVAVSDDPAGMYYNPAGIIFSSENYLSASVNTYSTSSETFKNVVPGRDYTYTSSALTPSFFGYLQNIGKGKFGFAVMIPNSDNIDQDDSLTALTTTPDGGNIFKRRYYNKDVTYLFGPAYAREIATNLTIGISLPAAIRSQEVIDNQYAIFNPASGGTNQRWWFQESYRSATTYALQPKLGVEYMPAPKLSLGLTVSMPVKLTASGKYTSRNLITTPSTLPTGYVSNDINQADGTINPRVPQVYQVAAGAAYFFTKQLMLTGEFDLYGQDQNYSGADVAAIPVSIQTTWNVSLGAEWYLADMFAVRGGFYTNRSNAPGLVATNTDQNEHVDQYCGALGFSYYHSGTSLSLTGNYGYGKGQGQGVGGTTVLQDVTRTTTTVLLSGSYQM